MKASLFCTTRYEGPSKKGVWPVPADSYDVEIAQKSYQRTLSQVRLGDDVGELLLVEVLDQGLLEG